jgi:phenylalanyl-tRNA synthetase beta chain
LKSIAGKEISVDELPGLLEYGKGELDSYDNETDEVFVSFGDTNLPYLWSVEGVARLIRGIIGKQKGIPEIEIFKKPEHRIIIDKSVVKIRPYIAAFVAKGCKVNDYTIKQMISLQEKFCESYGRRRKKVAVGIYNYKKIKFPVSYKATEPESIKFTPLEYKKEMTQQEILEEHAAGKEYSWILKDFKQYPLLVDSNKNVLSFPPIINSNYSGKIEIGDEDLFFEATGEDLDAVLLASNIFAQAFYERGFTIESVSIEYPEGDTIATPFLFEESMRISMLQIKSLTGLDLDEGKVKGLLEKMQYGFDKWRVKIPNYRRDIMHPVDVIEDIAIAYGYSNIELLHTKDYTAGKTFPVIKFSDKARELAVGLGYQEVFSAILSNKEILHEKMNLKDLGFNAVELKEFISEKYSCVRNWLIPILMGVLGKNKHAGYPQKIFEEGIVTVRKGSEVKDYRKLALITTDSEANYTEARQALDFILRTFGIDYRIEEAEHNSFMEGRAGKAIVNGKEVAFLGEINPAVLENFGLTIPAAGLEMNLTELFELVKK